MARRKLTALALTFWAACGGDDACDGEACAGESAMALGAALTNADTWRPVAAADDPFADRPSEVSCPASAVEVVLLPTESSAVGGNPGDRAYQVHTGDCSYLTAQQTTLLELQKGDRVSIRVWHFGLIAPQPGEGHAAIRIGNQTIWEQMYAIPQPAGLTEASWTVDETIPAGTPIYFHLHNHGTNTWSLWNVSAKRP